jgi:acetyl-CoA carboxylase biotin carboxylase subunit
MRRKMGEAAVKAAKAVNYSGAGTIEFIFDDKDQKFYFMEMNTRVQVEHTISEMITDVDIVREQILIASGEHLKIHQRDVVLKGHSIECRINAENHEKDFMPCPGELTVYLPPGGPGVRVDSHAYTGYTILPYYDSLIAKLIVWAPDRKQAIARAKRALDEYAIDGVKTTIPFHQMLLDHPEFVAGNITTNFIEKHFSELKKKPVAHG